MEIKKNKIIIFDDKVRFQANVIYDDIQQTDLIWFEFDKKYLPYLTTSANPWLISLVPLAFDLGQKLKLSLPVDELLLNNIKKVLILLKSWYPLKDTIPIEADTYKISKCTKINKTGVFFSGGVDSFYTVFKRDSNPTNENINYLLFIIGFDIPSAQNEDNLKKINKNLSAIANKLQKEIIIIRTNLRETRFKTLKWLPNYGFALASAANLFENLYSKVLISADLNFKDHKNQLLLVGDHPNLVPLFSTSNTALVLESADKSRMDKIKFLSNYTVAMENLRVCWKSKSFYNCSTCEKCFRTMTAFDLVNKLNNCSTFNIENYNLKNLSKIYIKNDTILSLWSELINYASNIKRQDIINAINKSFKISRFINLLRPIIKRLKKKKILSKPGYFIEKLLMKNIIK